MVQVDVKNNNLQKSYMFFHKILLQNLNEDWDYFLFLEI